MLLNARVNDGMEFHKIGLL